MLNNHLIICVVVVILLFLPHLALVDLSYSKDLMSATKDLKLDHIMEYICAK